MSLAFFLDLDKPDVSHFVCHQHRLELIWVSEWQDHPNGANAAVGVTYVSERPSDLAGRFTALYG